MLRRVVASLVVVAAAGTVAPLAGPQPAQAHHEPLIQPGAPVQLSGSVGGPYNQCTLNFIFRDARHTYIGTVTRCAQQLGERAAMAGREFGTVVFQAITLKNLADVDSVTKNLSSTNSR